jgi:hypothetical protein
MTSIVVIASAEIALQVHHKIDNMVAVLQKKGVQREKTSKQPIQQGRS